MKKLILFTCFLLLLPVYVVLAQKEPGVLRVRFDDRHPLTIAVNDRRFPKVAGSLTIGDLPRRRNHLDVYEYRAYKDGGGHAKLVFSGRVRIRPGMATYCIVERSSGRVKIYTREHAGGNDYSDPVFDGGRTAAPAPPASTETESPQQLQSPATPLSTDNMKMLEAQVNILITDADKDEFLQRSLAGSSVQTQQVRKMLSWFGSEKGKLFFAKWVYSQVSDPDQFLSVLDDAFIYESSRQELRDYINP